MPSLSMKYMYTRKTIVEESLVDDLSERFKELMIKDSEKESSKVNNSIINLEDKSDDEK